MRATNDAAIAVAAAEAVIRATIAAHAITSRVIRAMSRRASARIFQVARNNPVSPKAIAGSKAAEAAGDVGVGVVVAAEIVMAAAALNQKVSKAAARFNRAL